MKTRFLPGLVALLLGVGAHGCGADDVKLPTVDPRGGAPSGGTEGGERAGRGGGSATAGTDTGTGGTDSSGGRDNPGDGGEPPRPACETGALRCSGDTPQECNDGAWIDLDTCGGRTPVCVNGVCASVKLTGGLLSVGTVNTTEDGSIRLVDHGFEFLEVGRGTLDGRQITVVGALRP